MKLFHTTTQAAAIEILKRGFKDGVGYYLTSSLHRGVWLSDRPVDSNRGASGDTVLVVDLPLSAEKLREYEWVEDGKGYREFLLPAETINKMGQVSLVPKSKTSPGG